MVTSHLTVYQYKNREMKILYILLVFILVSSCSKESSFGPEFESFVGEWKNINGDLPITITIKKNGQVKVLKSIERGISFRANYLSSDTIEASTSKQYTLSKDKEIKDNYYLKFVKNPNHDTLVFRVGTLIMNSASMYDDDIKFIKD